MHDNKQVIRSYLLTDLDKIENRRIVKAEIFFLMNLVIVAFCRLTHPQTKLLDINPNVAPVCLASCSVQFTERCATVYT